MSPADEFEVGYAQTRAVLDRWIGTMGRGAFIELVANDFERCVRAIAYHFAWNGLPTSRMATDGSLRALQDSVRGDEPGPKAWAS
jgi:hypothetical protein